MEVNLIRQVCPPPSARRLPASAWQAPALGVAAVSPLLCVVGSQAAWQLRVPATDLQLPLQNAERTENLCRGRDLRVGLHLPQTARPRGGGCDHQVPAAQALHGTGAPRPQPLSGSHLSRGQEGPRPQGLRAERPSALSAPLTSACIRRFMP